MHPYYTVALAPAIAALVGIGWPNCGAAGSTSARRIWLGLMLAATGVWNFVCSTGHPTGSRGCGGRCWSARYWWPRC